MRNTNALIRCLAFACAVLPATSDSAQEHEQYIKLEAGPLFGESIQAQATGALAGSQKLTMRPGVRFNAEFGYLITDWLHGTFNTGLLMNGVNDGLRGNGAPYFYRIPFLAGVVVSYPNNSLWTPYAGLSAGASLVILDGKVDVGAVQLLGRAREIVFTWEFQAGLKYEWTETMDVTFGYRMIGISGPEFKYNNGPGPTKLQFEHALSHSFTVGLSWNF